MAKQFSDEELKKRLTPDPSTKNLKLRNPITDYYAQVLVRGKAVL